MLIKASTTHGSNAQAWSARVCSTEGQMHNTEAQTWLPRLWAWVFMARVWRWQRVGSMKVPPVCKIERMILMSCRQWRRTRVMTNKTRETKFDKGSGRRHPTIAKTSPTCDTMSNHAPRNVQMAINTVQKPRIEKEQKKRVAAHAVSTAYQVPHSIGIGAAEGFMQVRLDPCQACPGQ